MRALVLVLAVVLSFLLVLKFYPSAPVEGAEGGETSESSPGARYVGRPPGMGEPESSAPTEGRDAAAPPRDPEASAPLPAARETREPDSAGPPDGGWLRRLEHLALAEADEVRVARALLHETPQELARVLDQAGDGLASDRRLALLAFSEALAGNRSRAIELAQGIGDERSLGAQERAFLRAALEAELTVARPASARPEGPIELAMGLALLERDAVVLASRGEDQGAAEAFSQLLRLELDAPWKAGPEALRQWTAALDEAQEGHRWSPKGAWPSRDVVVEAGDTLTHVRLRYLDQAPAGALMCTGLIEKANRIRGYIHEGQTLRVPTDPVSVLVDLESRWVLYLHGDEVAAAWESGVGRPGEETIEGDFTAGLKEKDPMWWPRGQEPIPFGDPRNPLGTRWIGWFEDGAKTNYGFHGTNDPGSIGQAASDGCIRLRNEDVELLFDILPLHAPIRVQG